MTDATVSLDEPIVRGDQTISTLGLRRPKSGEMRGLSMIDLVQLKVDAVHELLPRITVPPLIAHEVYNLSPADMFKLSTEIAGFFLPKESAASPNE